MFLPVAVKDKTIMFKVSFSVLDKQIVVWLTFDDKSLMKIGKIFFMFLLLLFTYRETLGPVNHVSSHPIDF